MLVTPVPYKETAAYDLHITGKATFTQDRSALIIDVTSGTQFHLDVDCQCIASRPALRNMYTVRFAPHQIEAIQTTPLFRDTLAHMESGPVNARLYVCDGRVEHATLISHNGYEIEWVDFELIR